MTGFRENVQKPEYLLLIPLNPLIKIFFQNFGRATFLLNWPLTSYKILEKTNERSPRYIDGQTDRRTRAITMDPNG